MHIRFWVFLLGLLPHILQAQPVKKGFQLVPQTDRDQIEVRYNGQLLTAYCYTDSIRKPFLYPVNTLGGIRITRNYPVTRTAGERTDHPHHIGIWLNYESVNGIDFWNNSTAIAPDRRAFYGTILHDTVTQVTAHRNQAILKTRAHWVKFNGDTLLQENSTYLFEVRNQRFFITRSTQLTALTTPVEFKDVKDGFFAIRVARELEMPEPGKVAAVETGNYFAANGKTGQDVWSSQAPWAVLKGKINQHPICIALLDHPTNPGYPTYWHARGYGLFALNPLGRSVFSSGKDLLNLRLNQGESKTFTYQIVISETDLNSELMQTIEKQFNIINF